MSEKQHNNEVQEDEVQVQAPTPKKRGRKPSSESKAKAPKTKGRGRGKKSNQYVEVDDNGDIKEERLPAITEFIKYILPDCINECDIEDDNTISLLTLEYGLLSQSLVEEWVVEFPDVQEEGEHDYIGLFNKFSDEDLLYLCKTIRRKYEIQVVGIEHLTGDVESDDPYAVDEVDEYEEDEFDLDGFLSGKSNKKKNGRYTKEETINITAKFCSDISKVSEVLTAEKSYETFQKWEDGMKFTLSGFVAVPALVDCMVSMLDDVNNKKGRDDDEEYMKFKKLSDCIKGLEEHAYGEDELEQIHYLTKQLSNVVEEETDDNETDLDGNSDKNQVEGDA